MKSRAALWVGRSCLAASAILLIVVAVAYAGRFDGAAALTLYPFWCWAVLGLLVCATSHALHGGRFPFLVGAGWIACTAFFADELWPVLRELAPANVRCTNTVRVISLNCAGTADAMNEVVALRPDVALLQEVPGTNQVAQLATRLFGTNGSYVSGFDCAIVVRGSLTAQQVGPPFFITATWRTGTNSTLTLTSLRLVPPETRSDLWRPDAWHAYAENRRQRSRQLNEVLTFLRDHPGPQIIGGDFNAPGGDAIYQLLDGYTDAYAVAGFGWGHTALNNFPIVRPDQIWTKGIVPCSARAKKTLHSDHRLVIVEVTP